MMITSRPTLDPLNAFDHPVTLITTIAIVAVLIMACFIILALGRRDLIDDKLRRELWLRTISWAVLVPLLLGPVLLGPVAVIAGVCLLSLACYREFARATGLFRETRISLMVVLGIAALTFAVIDHWYGFFVALPALVISLIAAVAVTSDKPNGYIQRVGLGVFAFLLFGVCLGHLGYMANDGLFRPMLIWLVVCVEANDVFAFITGKLFGRAKLASNTSPGKTIGGAVGALICTTALAAIMGHFVFAGTPIDQTMHLIVLGIIISVTGQLGDLMLSSVKRDLGIKDTGVMIPGHGGLLDRFDSLLLVTPAVFHYVGYLRGIGLDRLPRIITGEG